MIPRDIAPIATELAGRYPVLTLTGPRQSGKTTLCRTLFPKKPYVTLEDPHTRRFAEEDPRGFLKGIEGGAVVEEIQRAPQIAPYLQAMVDADPTPGRFILTGNQQFELMSQVSQSLAGRTAVLQLLPFSLAEVARLHRAPPLAQTLLTGFLPRIHDQGLDPSEALGDYFTTYVERDLRRLTAVHDTQRFERFVRLCAGRIGQILNLTSLGNDAGVSHVTARAWLALLEASYIVHVLPPWLTNTSKRLVKSPKLYFHDVGLACWLLGLRSADQVSRDPLFGGLFENLVIMDALKTRFNQGESAEMYFFRDATGHEVDLLIPSGRKLRAVEIKAGATVNTDYFRGLRNFTATFPGALDGGSVVYGGDTDQAQSDCGWPVFSWERLQHPPGR
ncbi:ATP-binding protein [Variovorax sp. Sphag1AA]|uniref:ATP-binding protein n=1 Tax=Variovorax sp. Sphag1AA TaxID=2587027 RepID=UPI001619042B|nr:ATP-binding protein [Variovorax sp. Sphag1AA]MBB3182046.1 hypothetical protein [Variovorax sp. Sphag1AA]